MPPAGKDPWLEQGLKARTKFARVVWRMVKGKKRWFVQLAQEGIAPRKYETVDGAVVGLDVGPSSVAVYSEQGAGLVPLAPEVEQPWAKARRLQRAMDRSRRATNPQCFNDDGTWKRGTKLAVRSTAYQALRQELAETERVLEARCKRSHGALANRILFGLPTPERVARQRASATGDASDVAVERREPKRVGGGGPRTPWL